MPVPLVDVRAQYERLTPQILARFQEVLDSGTLILGPNVKAFEAEVAEQLGVPRTVGVANGTDALVLALDAMEIGPGDEVICPSFTFYATAESIARRGATPVFADIAHASYYVTPLHLQPALRYLGWKEGSLPETERAARENLALPMWAGIPAEAQERVVSVIREAAAVRA